MPNESPAKRKIEPEDLNSGQLKRTKSIAQEDLKESIVKEITQIFEDRISKLEARIKRLEEEILIDEEETKHEDDKIEKEVDDEAKRPERKLLNKEPPPLPPRKATFGSNSFSFSPGKVTPLNSFNDVNTVPSSPKPVFGATTSFGSMDRPSTKSSSPEQKPEFKSPSAFTTSPTATKDSATNNTNTTTTTSSTNSTFGSAFGSNSRFGNAFKDSLNKKSFLDNDEPEKKDDTVLSTNNNENTPPAKPQEYKQVDLAPVEQTTGEEDEISHFNCPAKIFELDLAKMNEGWKERGVGPLHLNQSKVDQKKVRLVMRSQGLLRVVLNYKITADTELLKGLGASLTPEKFLRLNSVSPEGTPIQYLLKFGSGNLRDELIEKIESLKEVIKE
ncbi:Ran-specific GTPase-activating protein 2 [Candida viswanathii]|uniref:Ran-specific GTPase-activating protein 2 n=1 Tax=Candida viswanathii TaxID=5486 RepID=A0A367XLU3_9ASCO|nr:Ran-specific GTPase-activating protein 2 [Candida viswanathii]